MFASMQWSRTLINYPKLKAFRMPAAVGVDNARGARPFVQNSDPARALGDLKWKRQIGRTWYAWKEALGQRVRFCRILPIDVSLGHSPRLIGNHTTLDDALPGWYAWPCRVIFKVPGSPAQRLPNPAQVGFTISRPGRPIRIRHWCLAHHGRAYQHDHSDTRQRQCPSGRETPRRARLHGRSGHRGAIDQ